MKKICLKILSIFYLFMCFTACSANNMDAQENEKSQLCDFIVETDEDRDIVVLQLTDTQIIDAGQLRTDNRLSPRQIKYWASNQIENRCYGYLREIITETEPDLILLTGDLVYGEFDDNGTMFLSLIEFMESFNIPWAPIFGNHDNESFMGEDWQCEQLENAKHCLFIG